MAFFAFVRRRHLIAYVAVLTTVVFMFVGLRDEGQARRTGLAHATRLVAVAGCIAQNQTRDVLRTLVHQNQPLLERLARRGLLTQGEFALYNHNVKRADRLTRKLDCRRTARRIPTAR